MATPFLLYRVAGVRFERSGPVHFVDPRDLDLAVDDPVVVATPQGPRVGIVVIAPRQVIHSEVRGPLPFILRRATAGEQTPR
ncbi:MAG: hypothetical protein NZ951_03055 [Dehalococcoidia bacterium]|nr:hypothetical protein [Dehalococcoidia bacterium]MDW8119442.1 hypothetical protein [Chloroflexota bacterium]